MNTQELKAYAFDLVNTIQKYNMELQKVSQMIEQSIKDDEAKKEEPKEKKNAKG